MFTSGRLSAYLQYAYSFVAVQVLVQHGRRLPVERLVKRSAWIAIARIVPASTAAQSCELASTT